MFAAFTYQVVALFPESPQLSQLKHLELVLVANSSSTSAQPEAAVQPAQEVLHRVRLTNQRHLNRVRVFTDGWGQVGSIQGEHVFTGLVLFQSVPHTNNYTATTTATSANTAHGLPGSPLKFIEALIHEQPLGLATKSSADKRAELEEASKVFVNYMSHIGFEERAAKSGPLRLKWISGRREARE